MTHRTIAEFVSRLKDMDVQVFIEGDRDIARDEMRLRCTAPAGTLTADLRQELVDRKAELISYLHPEAANTGQEADRRQEPFLPTSPTADSQFLTSSQCFPLSFAQQRLWFLDQLAPGNPFYNVPAAIRLTGALNQAALERSFREIGRRHATLRTHFTTLDEQPVQVVEPHIEIELAVVDLQTVAVNDRERLSQQLATTEAQRPFNLTTDTLLRLTLLQFEAQEFVLLLTLHHIVADGWSLGVLIRELAECYTAFVQDRSPVLPPLPIQYSDFALWQRQWLQGEVLEKQLTYWRRQLQDLPLLELPGDRPRPAVQTYRGATYPLQFSPALTQALEALSQQCGVSLFMILLAALQTLLHRYTGQKDIAIGAPIANRHRSEVEGLIGFFVNSLVLRSDLSGNPTFRELLTQVRQVALEAYEHQDLPFEKLVEELDPDRDPSRNPLFQVALALQNAPMQSLELPGLTLEPAPLQSSSTRFDLEIHLWEPTHGLRSLWQSQAGLSGFISYSTDLFDRARIERLVAHFETLLQGIVTHPDDRLADLPLLTAAEWQRLLGEWNPSPLPPVAKGELLNELPIPTLKQNLAPPTANLCFHQIFEAQVQSAPNAIALVTEYTSLTYLELNQRADHLAHTLRQMGVQPDTLVGLCVDRSADMVIGILGILKAGGAYVPLDPNYPSDRLQFLLSDTQVSLLLSQSWLGEALPPASAPILYLDQPLPLNPTSHALAPPSPQAQSLEAKGSNNPVAADNLAYVIYTSGSTGTPKGVLLNHRGLCNVVAAQQHHFHLSPQSRILQFSSLSFDASNFEIALALGAGGTLYIPPRIAQLPGMALIQFLQDQAITHALLTPAVLAVLPAAELSALQVLITGGEACSRQVVERWAPNRYFFNAYGPTETTIWATVASLHPGDDPLTIGRPILNTQVYILDANLNPLPVGIPGELYIGGIGLARGYWNRPELTAERFIPSPFDPEARLYQTGDRAQYRADGTIEFLGRVDTQIKIRGFRVELGEIEATLQRHPAIQDAVVLASIETLSEKRLITYFSLNQQYLQQTVLPSLRTQHLHHWQTLYNQTYQSTQPQPASPDPQFNITGWNSSYTGEPIPLEQMQEWVSDRVQQILALRPQRVLEIGCGTGLLLFQIAPHCQQYVGTDFSAVSLETLQVQLDALNLSQVTLLQRGATDFEDIDPAAFDLVILNSIVQYFPSQGYLLQVLAGALAAVAPGGMLFIGDVRSLPLLTAFHSWMQFCQADAGMERDRLRQLVDRSRFEEPELAIDPTFFDALGGLFPQIRAIHIRLPRGRSQNEMMQFRYNVWLQVEQKLPEQNSSQQIAPSTTAMRGRREDQHAWNVHPIPVSAVRDLLMQTEPAIFVITRVANRRVSGAVSVTNWLRSQAAPKTVGCLRERLQDAAELAIDPQDWWDLETGLPYRVEITWSTQTSNGDYDVWLMRRGVDATFDRPFPQQPLSADQSHTNNPLQSHLARQLLPELRQYLQQTLPDYMMPATFVPLEALPLTPNGKVDRISMAEQSRYALLPLNDHSSPASAPTATGLTTLETTLLEIWQELLHLKQVSLHDNFFELGGHSLLATQMTSRVRDALGLELPLKNVFEAPTIAQLAPLLETLQNAATTPTAPPLVRLERSAYRHKRAIVSAEQGDHPTSSSESQNGPITPESAVIASRSLVPLALGDRKQPFFCIHPLFGVVFPYLELAHHLHSQRSFYGLQPPGLDGKTPPLNRIEAIASHYIQAIQTLQPQGPYFLGGWSFGGLVAFEMAQQLTQAGQQIELLAILDTPAPCHKPSFCQGLKFLLGTALWSTLPFLLDYGALTTDRLRSQNSWFSRQQWSAITRLIPEESRLQLLDESAIRSLLPIVYANSQAAYRYTPQTYSERLTLFKATEQPESLRHEPTLGWNALAGDIQLHQVPGNHLSLLQQPHVQTLAEQLRQCLA